MRATRCCGLMTLGEREHWAAAEAVGGFLELHSTLWAAEQGARRSMSSPCAVSCSTALLACRKPLANISSAMLSF
jgi:hypothetical protein